MVAGESNHQKQSCSQEALTGQMSYLLEAEYERRAEDRAFNSRIPDPGGAEHRRHRLERNPDMMD